jgi:hypothetical protein
MHMTTPELIDDLRWQLVEKQTEESPVAEVGMAARRTAPDLYATGSARSGSVPPAKPFLPPRPDVREALLADSWRRIDRAVESAGRRNCRIVSARLRCNSHHEIDMGGAAGLDVSYCDGVIRLLDRRSGELVLIAQATQGEALLAAVSGPNEDTPLVLMGQGDGAAAYSGDELF